MDASFLPRIRAATANVVFRLDLQDAKDALINARLRERAMHQGGFTPSNAACRSCGMRIISTPACRALTAASPGA